MHILYQIPLPPALDSLLWLVDQCVLPRGPKLSLLRGLSLDIRALSSPCSCICPFTVITGYRNNHVSDSIISMLPGNPALSQLLLPSPCPMGTATLELAVDGVGDSLTCTCLVASGNYLGKKSPGRCPELTP